MEWNLEEKFKGDNSENSQDLGVLSQIPKTQYGF